MSTALLLARLLLAFVVAVAAFAKVADRRGARAAARDLGAPERLAGPLAVALPVTEVVVAAGLLAAATAWWAAIAALGLLAAFTTAIASSLARGRRVACHCFGRLSSGAVGPATLVRNGALVALAAFVVAAGHADAGQGAGVLPAAALAVGALALALVGRHAADAATPSRGLPVGAPAPAFTLAGPGGRRVSLEDLATDRPTLLVFVDPGCVPCAELLPDLARWRAEHARTLAVAVVSRGSEAANREKLEPHGLQAARQADHEVASAFGAYGTPSAVLLAADRTIASPVAGGVEDVRDLVAAFARGDVDAVAAGRTSPGPELGEPLPRLLLPDLAGRPVALAPIAGEPTVVLIFSPHCGFCREMVDDLRRWEAENAADVPRLLVLSRGDAALSAGLGLAAPVLLDERLEAGRALRARGTPSAILVDGDGRVASGLARGAAATRALIGLGPAADNPTARA